MQMKLWNFQFKLGFVVLFWIIACKSETSQTQEKQKENQIKITNTVDSVTNSLTNSNYKLSIKTSFSNDTADVIDYKEDRYSTPIVLNQSLTFFHDDSLIKDYRPSIGYSMKKTIGQQNLRALQAPIYQICITKTKEGIYYYVINGSDYCNGSDCPEFIGIYSMLGKVIYEGISTSKEKTSIIETLSNYKIELSNKERCVQLDIFK